MFGLDFKVKDVPQSPSNTFARDRVDAARSTGRRAPYSQSEAHGPAGALTSPGSTAVTAAYVGERVVITGERVVRSPAVRVMVVETVEHIQKRFESDSRSTSNEVILSILSLKSLLNFMGQGQIDQPPSAVG